MSGSKIFLPKVVLVAAVALTLAGCGPNPWEIGANRAGANGAGAGAIGAAADPTSSAYFRETVGDRVLFAVDQSSIDAAAQVVLQAQARWLTANPDYTITIEGHADAQGTREYNLALGARRANAAREYLISQGIAGSRIHVVTFGKERPIEICSAEACYSQNRRAVTVLAGGLVG